MNNSYCFDKTGIINRINENKITIQLLTSEACGTCRIKTFCIKNNDIIDVQLNNNNTIDTFKNGDLVKLEVNKNHAYKAVFYAYFLPAIFIIFLLILSMNIFHIHELLSGIIVIFFSILYFFVLSLFKNKLKEKIKITIKKFNE